jgi:hypothetical protein
MACDKRTTNRSQNDDEAITDCYTVKDGKRLQSLAYPDKESFKHIYQKLRNSPLNCVSPISTIILDFFVYLKKFPGSPILKKSMGKPGILLLNNGCLWLFDCCQ